MSENFATSVLQTAHADGRTWTGYYIYGRETYIEIFGPRPKRRTGQSGIGLGVDTIGDLEALARKVRSPTMPFEIRPWNRNNPDGTNTLVFLTAQIRSILDLRDVRSKAPP